MWAQLKYSAKRMPVGVVDRACLYEGGRGAGVRNQGSGPSTFVRWCDRLKSFIFDYGAPSHPELYRKSKEALLDYIRVEYAEGDAVAESILSAALAYPPKPSDPPAGALRTDEEIWK